MPKEIVLHCRFFSPGTFVLFILKMECIFFAMGGRLKHAHTSHMNSFYETKKVGKENEPY